MRALEKRLDMAEADEDSIGRTGVFREEKFPMVSLNKIQETFTFVLGLRSIMRKSAKDPFHDLDISQKDIGKKRSQSRER